MDTPTAYPPLSPREARQRGRQTEDRFFSAFREPGIILPEWFYGVRRSSVADDKKGIDAYAVVDIGELPIQIKTSFGGFLNYLERHPINQCTIVVLPTWLAPAEIRSKSLHYIRKRRKTLLYRSRT